MTSDFLHQQNWPPQYNWNIVESGVKHHQTKKQTKSNGKIEERDKIDTLSTQVHDVTHKYMT